MKENASPSRSESPNLHLPSTISSSAPPAVGRHPRVRAQRRDRLRQEISTSASQHPASCRASPSTGSSFQAPCSWICRARAATAPSLASSQPPARSARASPGAKRVPPDDHVVRVPPGDLRRPAVDGDPEARIPRLKADGVLAHEDSTVARRRNRRIGKLNGHTTTAADEVDPVRQRVNLAASSAKPFFDNQHHESIPILASRHPPAYHASMIPWLTAHNTAPTADHIAKGEGRLVIHYRPFRNPDSPAVVEAWNASFTGRRVVPVRMTTLLEYFTLAKPYFDPRGADPRLRRRPARRPGPRRLRPRRRRRRPGHRDGRHLRPGRRPLAPPPGHRRRTAPPGRGVPHAARRRRRSSPGRSRRNNPFTFGLYGGCDSPGFLASDVMARPFFEKHGYQLAQERRAVPAAAGQGLPAGRPAVRDDPAEVRHHRRRRTTGRAGGASACWGRSRRSSTGCRTSSTGRSRRGACCGTWRRSRRPGARRASGMIDLFVEPAHRRQGLAQVPAGADPAAPARPAVPPVRGDGRAGRPRRAGAAAGLEFQQVDTGHCFRRMAR